jgi:hypothetical protein
MTTAIHNAINQGLTVTIASGNEAQSNGISWPACISGVLSVGDVYSDSFGGLIWTGVCTDATTFKDKLICHCNRGNILDILAPGAMICSTRLPGDADDWVCGDGTFIQKGGTSMATPHVAGGAALINQYAQLVGISLTPQQVEDLLKENADDIGYTWPRLNVLAAINTLSTNCNVSNPQNSLNCLDETISYTQDAIMNVSANYTDCTITAHSITVGSNGTVVFWPQAAHTASKLCRGPPKPPPPPPPPYPPPPPSRWPPP